MLSTTLSISQRSWFRSLQRPLVVILIELKRRVERINNGVAAQRALGRNKFVHLFIQPSNLLCVLLTAAVCKWSQSQS